MSNTKNNEKWIEYAMKLTAHLEEIFNEDCENFIDKKEFSEGDNATDFIHALANVVPYIVFNEITGDNKDQLGFNHIANRLIVQFQNK